VRATYRGLILRLVLAAALLRAPSGPAAGAGRDFGRSKIELGIVDEDECGFYFVAGTLDGDLQRVDLTDDLFSHPPVVIDGLAVHVVSPLALYQMRDAFIRLGTFGAPRDKDVTVQAKIREHLLEDGDLVNLAPAMSPFVQMEEAGSSAPDGRL
jgi:hypothetical protein